jgi:microcystin-dependent protein
MLRKALMIVMAATAFATASLAQQTPDLSGTWKLNLEKTDFGQMPAPTGGTDVIEQRGSVIKQSVESESQYGKREFVLTFSTDGKETKYTPDSGPIVGRATLLSISSTWQDGSLIVKMLLDYQGNDVEETDTYSLSQDAMAMTVSSNMKSAMGERTRKMVFDRVRDSEATSSSAAATTSAAAPSSSPAATAAPASASSSITTTSPATASSPAVAASSIGAQATPNLTGTWILNLSKSTFGDFPPPISETDKIVDNEPSVKIGISQIGGPMGDMNFTMDLSTDGKETTASSMFGGEVKHKARWDGNSLVVDSTMNGPNGEGKFTSKYTLDADGKTLTVKTHISGGMGDMDMKSVFEKQP